jgi:uncharacterized protein (DUF885 family)
MGLERGPPVAAARRGTGQALYCAGGPSYCRAMRLFIPVLSFALLAACARAPKHAAVSETTGDAQFTRLSEEYLAGYLAWRPQTGTTLGLHQYDGKITDFSKASLESELARLHSFDTRLAALPTNALSAQAFYDYRLLRAAVQHEIFSFEGEETYTRNPMTYASAIDLNIYIKRNFAPLAQRVASIISILEEAPRIMQSARQNLETALPRPQVETAMDQATGAADFLAKDLVDALKPLTEPELRKKFEAADERAISELRGFANFLKQEKLPKATENYALGMEKYRRLLETGEMLEIEPDRLLDIGTLRLREQQRRFAEIAAQIDPAGKPQDVFQAIQKDHPTPESLVPDTARDLELIRQFVVDHEIVTIPSPVRAQVTETPQYLRATSFASMDTPGPFETRATEAYYYVTPTEPDWPAQQKEEWLTAFNYYTTDIVSIHEAYPGHYVQFLCLNASPATTLEKVFTSYAFVEGWAHYTEQMMIEQGFGAAPPTPPGGSGNTAAKAAKYRLAQADEALLRLCRLCVSIQMHCHGMTVDEATKFFQDNCYYEQKTARQEAVRGTFDPEYLYYTVGKLEILKLRKDYQRQEGSSFSLRRFHDAFLRNGAPPVRLVRERLLKDPALWDKVF